MKASLYNLVTLSSKILNFGFKFGISIDKSNSTSNILKTISAKKFFFFCFFVSLTLQNNFIGFSLLLKCKLRVGSRGQGHKENEKLRNLAIISLVP
jgi:hypothetical protein